MEQKTLFKEEEKEINLKDEEGFFILERVKVNYKFKAKEFGLPHLEFTSAEDKKPNLISETGYRSWFINWDLSESVIGSVRQLIEIYLEELLKGKKYTLEFKEEDEPEIETEEKNKGSDWKEINEMIKRCGDKEEYSYIFVEYHSNPTLESKNERLSISSTHQKPKGQMGNSWGSWGWENGGEETTEKFMEGLLDFVRNNSNKPYHPTIDGIFTTSLKRENILISFCKRAREYLEKAGFDFKKFEKELKEITQETATKDDIRKSTTFDLMEKQVDKLKDDCWAIKGFFDEHSFLLKTSTNYRKDYYTKKLEELKIETNDLNKLRDLYNKKARSYQIFYTKVYEQMHGEKPEEEYTYP